MRSIIFTISSVDTHRLRILKVKRYVRFLVMITSNMSHLSSLQSPLHQPHYRANGGNCINCCPILSDEICPLKYTAYRWLSQEHRRTPHISQSVSGKYFWINWGCGRFFGLDYAARPRLRRYSIGLIASTDILIRSALYQRRKPYSSYMNTSKETPSHDLV